MDERYGEMYRCGSRDAEVLEQRFWEKGENKEREGNID